MPATSRVESRPWWRSYVGVVIVTLLPLTLSACAAAVSSFLAWQSDQSIAAEKLHQYQDHTSARIQQLELDAKDTSTLFRYQALHNQRVDMQLEQILWALGRAPSPKSEELRNAEQAVQKQME